MRAGITLRCIFTVNLTDVSALKFEVAKEMKWDFLTTVIDVAYLGLVRRRSEISFINKILHYSTQHLFFT